ncbi:hypothetical protein pipiens_005883 [Culex pipiens pipiens]|uniref:Uncharacterized protein n=1 Tax=Culex pipiens pipiens TaxID=38569 RepID=A0ABD1DX55_CULPP
MCRSKKMLLFHTLYHNTNSDDALCGGCWLAGYPKRLMSSRVGSQRHGMLPTTTTTKLTSPFNLEGTSLQPPSDC